MAAAASSPEDLRSHPEHDWARIEGDVATLGITWYAQDALGEIVHYEPPDEGSSLAKERIRKFVADLSSTSGTTVLLTTHDMDDVEALCERLILIDHGKVLYDGTPAALKDSYAPHRELVVQLASPCEVEVSGAQTVESRDGVVRLSFNPTEISAAALISELFGNYPVTDVSLQETDLEDVIKKIYAGRS